MLEGFRLCFKCKGVLDFEHFVITNSSYSEAELDALWSSEFLEFYCCNCAWEVKRQIKKEIFETKPKEIKFVRPCSCCNEIISDIELRQIFRDTLRFKLTIDYNEANRIIDKLQDPDEPILCNICYYRYDFEIQLKIEENTRKKRKFYREVSRLKIERIANKKEKNRYKSKLRKKGFIVEVFIVEEYRNTKSNKRIRQQQRILY